MVLAEDKPKLIGLIPDFGSLARNCDAVLCAAVNAGLHWWARKGNMGSASRNECAISKGHWGFTPTKLAS